MEEFRTVRTVMALLLFQGAGCAAPRPVLYPNDRYQSVGKDKAKEEVDDCIAQAKGYVDSQKGKMVAKKTGWGAATGAVIGMIEGAFTGNMGRAAAEGAAVGGALGLAGGAYDAGNPDSVFCRFVDICLAKKGYQPIGWK